MHSIARHISWCVSPHQHYKEHVLAGIQLLDEKCPDWRDYINWDVLNMGKCDNCLLGQLYEGDYVEGLIALGLRIMDGHRYGFDVYGGYYDDYNTLTEIWKTLGQGHDEPQPIPVEPVIKWIPPRYKRLEDNQHYGFDAYPRINEYEVLAEP